MDRDQYRGYGDDYYMFQPGMMPSPYCPYCPYRDRCPYNIYRNQPGFGPGFGPGFDPGRPGYRPGTGQPSCPYRQY